jgi:hypothetical protein
LVKLLLLAEGAEKECILSLLSVARGRPVTETEATEDGRRVVDEEQFLRRVAGSPDLLGRGRFAQLTRAILTQEKRGIDESLNRILELWFTYTADPGIGRYFDDAARFLEIGLLSRSKTQPDRYRVVAPVSFGDGLLHPPGEIVTLDLDTAREYSHSLQRVEESGEESQEKKLA